MHNFNIRHVLNLLELVRYLSIYVRNQSKQVIEIYLSIFEH